MPRIIYLQPDRSKVAKQIPYKLQERPRLDPVKRGKFQHSTTGRTQMSCKLQERPRPNTLAAPRNVGNTRTSCEGPPLAAPWRPAVTMGGPAHPVWTIILEQTGRGTGSRVGTDAASSSIVSTASSQTGCADNFVLEPSRPFLPSSLLCSWALGLVQIHCPPGGLEKKVSKSSQIRPVCTGPP